MLRLYFSTFCILVLFCNPIQAKTTEIKVVTEDTFPIQYLENGKVLGPATDLVKAVLAEANINYTIEVLPWARAYNEALTKPNILIYSLARTTQREALFQWIGSLMDLDYYLVGLESLKLPEFVTLEYLQTLSIGVIRNSATEQHLMSLGFKNLYTVSKPSQSINMLKSKRIDLFPTNYASFQFSCLYLKENCLDIKPIYQLDQLSTSLYFALSNQTNPQLVNKIKTAYKVIMKLPRN